VKEETWGRMRRRDRQQQQQVAKRRQGDIEAKSERKRY